MLLAIDFETAPQEQWVGFEKAALDMNRNRITLAAVYGEGVAVTTRDMDRLATFSGHQFISHGKFDLKLSLAKGLPIGEDQWAHDTNLMAVALARKIPNDWLEAYETKRKEVNRELGRAVHREAGKHSLKTLAPYFLGVEPFWEVADHNNEEYALKDARYCYELFFVLKAELEREGGWDFYEQKLLPWASMLVKAELEGIDLDYQLMDRLETEAKVQRDAADTELKRLWAPAFVAYREQQVAAIEAEYQQKKLQFIQKLKPVKLKNAELAAARTAEKIRATSERYDSLKSAALQKIADLNMASPAQMAWLLRDHFGHDLSTFDGKDESTGAPVLERLAAEGAVGVDELLRYREADKLVTAFFPSYREKAFNGRIHTNFNLDIARTGRLSSDNPNLQQVPGHLHCLFRASPGMKLICKDLSSIEPALAAYVTEDRNLCSLYLARGNFHDRNVEVVFGYPKCDRKVHANERRFMKEVGLSILYGAGAGRVQETAAKYGYAWKIGRCRQVVKDMRFYYSGVWAYKEELDRRLESGELIRNVLGRPVVCDADNIYMQGFNTAMQGGASDLMLESVRRALAECEATGLGVHLLLLVHDELVLKASEADAQAAEAIVDRHLKGWRLATQYGDIYTDCEGGIADCWVK
jgi:DNA polymerase I-like protein with 3'-5' exonuclease and polymerase domains